MSQEGNSSGLNNLIQTKLHQLKPTTTKVTSFDGTITIHDHETVRKSEETHKTYGFVLDLEPDLTVGMVKPWLYISSQDIPSDPNRFDELQITHVLSLLPHFILPERIRRHTEHLCLEIYDEPAFQLSNQKIIQKAIDFINLGRASRNGRVLVHCNAGISRAPSIVIAYLILQEDLRFDEAWAIVRNARPVAKPNNGFMTQLKQLHK